MKLNAVWQDTKQGRALCLEVQGRKVNFLQADMDEPGRSIYVTALSLWEGLAGDVPAAWLQRWRWRRGLRHLQKLIAQAVREGVAQEPALT